jgi:undecaprenyl-diphosphatase
VVRLLIEPPKDYSFPSGHTGMAFAVTSGLFFMKKKELGIAALILACLIAFSRMYLYVHYPTDVLVGLIIGLLSGYAGYQLYQYLEKKLNNETDIDKA